MKKYWRGVLFLTLAGLIIFGIPPGDVLADGTETLGPPSITTIAQGTGIVAAGTGLLAQPGTIEIEVPAGATVEQVLLYWEGFMKTDTAGDNTIVIEGSDVTGTLIGGPAFFFSRAYSSAYRADITGLGLVVPGSNTLSVDGLEFTRANNGAGILVIYDDSSGLTDIDIRDGLDLAFINFPEPRKSTIAQTFDFTPAAFDRQANLALFFSSVAGSASGADPDRPSSIDLTVDGTTTTFSNELNSNDGDEWDTVNVSVMIPAGASSLTVQAFSRDDLNTGDLPASFTWTAAAFSIQELTASLGDRVWEDLNGNGIQDCEDTNNNDIIGDAGDTGPECDAGIPNVAVELREVVGGNCTETVLDSTATDGQGFYLFEGLTPGDYCVFFDLKTVPGDVCDFGAPQFTLQNQGGDDALDSDADPDTGITPVITLAEGQTDLTWDAGIVCPGPASLGDRVWEDRNGDGIQDCEDTNNNDIIGDAGDTGPECDAGIPGVTVELREVVGGNCTDTVLDSTTTDDQGFYLFEGLTPGEYCVFFDLDTVPGDVCDFGAPQFTQQNQGGDNAVDSDADPATGVTDVITLAEGQTDLTWDAGIVCPGPASLGDRVWEDLDGDGIQDCADTNDNGIIGDAGDTGPECDAGIPGVTVELREVVGGNCTDTVLDSTTTDDQGFYLFEGLTPGEYCVFFDLDTVPGDVCDVGAPQFTQQNQGGDDAVDSDADPVTGVTDVITLGEGQTDLTWDAGIVCPECAISVVKTCEVIEPDPEPFVCDDKVDALKMIWDGPGTLQSVAAYRGDVGEETLPAVISTEIINGIVRQVVTVSGYQPSTNDVQWEWVSESDSGISEFHLSCSDPEMNGPEDCGTPQGDGKNEQLPPAANVWLLDGLSTDKGFVLDCTPELSGGAEECTIQSQIADCESIKALTGDKPDNLTWQYTGGGCGASDNSQDSGDLFCDEFGGGVNKDQAVTITDDDGNVFEVEPGGVFTTTRDASKVFTLVNDGGREENGRHVSCSQPLIAGDIYGSLTLAALEGIGIGAEVRYLYKVTNNNDSEEITDISVVDDPLATSGVPGSPISFLVPDESQTLELTTFISQTTVNTVTVSGTAGGTKCAAEDSVTVTVLPPPPCEVTIRLDKIEDDKIKWKLSNLSSVPATIETLTITWPGNGDLKKVKYDGSDILKDVLLSSPATITSGEWLKQPKDRTVEVGDTGKELKLEFDQKFPDKKNQDPADFDLTVSFEQGCEVSF